MITTGSRIRRPGLIMYYRMSENPGFGVVVGKVVGNAVHRNRVKRVLRHQAMTLIPSEPPMEVVVRALPGTGNIAEQLKHAWTQAVKECAQ